MEVEVPELRQLYMSSTELWDTGQQAIMDEHAGLEFVDLSAFFGWCCVSRGTNAAGVLCDWKVREDEDMMGHDGPYQQYDGRGECRHVPRRVGHQVGRQAVGAHHQQVHHDIQKCGQPPDDISNGGDDNGDATTEEEVCVSSGNDETDVEAYISLKISFRNKYEQRLSVLEGGGASLVVKCRRHEGQNKSVAALHLGSPRGEKSGQAQALWLAGRHI